jgi:hypothetical protein
MMQRNSSAAENRGIGTNALRTGRLDSVQVLLAIAAISAVAFHTPLSQWIRHKAVEKAKHTKSDIF